MNNSKSFLKLNLQLFAEGAGAGAGTGAEGATGATETAAVSQKGVKGNPLANVKYGIQPEDDAQIPDVQTKITDADGVTSQTIDRKAEFKKLINGEYKQEFDEWAQDTVQKRLKGTKEIVDKYNSLTPMFEKLSAKYGVDATDVDALMKAIDEDDSYYEQEALERGIPVEEVKRQHRLEKENADFRRLLKQHNADKKVAEWLRQGDELKKVYPTFDFNAELKNPEFEQLLNANINVRRAYEAVHFGDLVEEAMRFSVKTTEKKVTDKIIANGARPSENGISSQSASVTKSDVSKLTGADIDEIKRQVARGKKITFG